MLRHLAAGGEAQDFPGTKFENLAIARTIERRGLIAWDGEGHRYVLTPAGWGELTPRRFGLPSLLVSTATGAAIGAAALAFLWLPDARWQDSAHGHATTALAVQSLAPARAPAPALSDIGGRSIAPMSPAAPKPAPAARVPATEPSTAGSTPAAPQPTPAAYVPPTEPTTAAAAPSEPAEIAAQPAAEQPNTEPAPASPKHVAAKKHHRRSVRRTDPYNPFANSWRGQQYQQTRYGQGSWYAYR